MELLNSAVEDLNLDHCEQLTKFPKSWHNYLLDSEEAQVGDKVLNLRFVKCAAHKAFTEQTGHLFHELVSNKIVKEEIPSNLLQDEVTVSTYQHKFFANVYFELSISVEDNGVHIVMIKKINITEERIDAVVFCVNKDLLPDLTGGSEESDHHKLVKVSTKIESKLRELYSDTTKRKRSSLDSSETSDSESSESLESDVNSPPKKHHCLFQGGFRHYHNECY